MTRPRPEHGHAHDDLSDQGELEQFSLSENPEDTPPQGHSHGKPVDIRKYFDEEDLAAQYNLHQEANRLDMASLTDEIVLSNDAAGDPSAAARIQLTTSRLHNPGRPGDLAAHDGTAGRRRTVGGPGAGAAVLAGRQRGR